MLVFTNGVVQCQERFSLPVLETPVEVVRYGLDTAEVLLYNMHDNENTSAMAGRVFGEKYAGSYHELMHTGKRNISILFGEDSIHIDPNRIYTDNGIMLQLEKNGINDSVAFQSIAVWRDSLLSHLKIESRTLVIALHNNTAYNYSFKSYMPGEEYADEAQHVKKGSIRDKDDFYFVTDSTQFSILSQGKYNVVLQSTATLTDDGSLSVYCGQLGIPYVNVEAQHGHLPRQINMLVFAYRELVEKQEASDHSKEDKRRQKKELRQLRNAAKG